MKTYKTKWFHKWAVKEGVMDESLVSAVQEISSGLIDADLGGHVVKKRVGLHGRGKRGGVRTLVAFRHEDKAFFIYGFAKNERANITQKELKALRILAAELLHYGTAALEQAVDAEELIEVINDG
ncbi:type II toxin-antitoxin system RelE/ParE family toxin [Candidatus Vondammii sp. HM_W22]|uniref:type II toxin-antitoxin system RelE/ParE family toxin n=1 Tax=Candidatus Vondammii sp. HM_W22 TaxID=2687299 RepID=UPI001F13F74F|nr:type II toxin-antitoxin system RelE/ParE family toxin [Candidatus Vondammii sp. HM_W22]